MNKTTLRLSFEARVLATSAAVDWCRRAFPARRKPGVSAALLDARFFAFTEADDVGSSSLSSLESDAS